MSKWKQARSNRALRVLAIILCTVSLCGGVFAGILALQLSGQAYGEDLTGDVRDSVAFRSAYNNCLEDAWGLAEETVDPAQSAGDEEYLMQTLTSEGFYFTVTNDQTGETVLTNAETEGERQILADYASKLFDEGEIDGDYCIRADCTWYFPENGDGTELVQLVVGTDPLTLFQVHQDQLFVELGDGLFYLVANISYSGNWADAGYARFEINPYQSVDPQDYTLKYEDGYTPSDLSAGKEPAAYTMHYGADLQNAHWSGLGTEVDQARDVIFFCNIGICVCAVLGLLSTLWLCFAAGHRKDTEEIAVTGAHRWGLDAVLILFFFAGLFLLAASNWGPDYQTSNGASLFNYSLLFSSLWYTAIGSMLLILPLHLLFTVAVRIKAGTLLKNWALLWLWKQLSVLFLDHLKFAVRATLIYGVYCLVDLIALLSGGIDRGAATIWLLLHVAVYVAGLYWCLKYQEVRAGAARLAAGETVAGINTEKMPHDLKVLGEQLNDLSAGINLAVEKQLKSERFRSELITNVSHDLKTPLTSIINYIDLLKGTEITDPAALEYLEVLDRKSQRLKKLTEDLVEASKASTGNLKVEKTPLDFVQLVNQALGEYEEKLTAAGLTPVVRTPEPPVTVLADGRHLWRVLDNLLNNCVKYALKGTRIYLDMADEESFVRLEVKNISAQPLNISAEELMERFVRGDSSRTTEGSGLGLNIAMSLTQLQGGTFDISVDGDLFKAIVKIPRE